ncbi:DUF948 domain-containing protein [Fischerella sp. JS2]|uniref:DUF948 domain-containing protein n=1 Tax=Fischerella sp. JS2 TaxID=2597771 RepID=UPI0028E1D48F|nr:DUF948 domain-containing protein [Fischerella sp. JS2]
MSEPLFWLGLSIFLVAISLTAVLVVAIPALQELARAARSAEKLFDTLSRELPPTLDAIRMAGLEINELTDDVSEGVKSASGVVKQVDQSLNSAKQQAQNIQINTRSVFVGVKAAWKSFTRSKPAKRTSDRLLMNQKGTLKSRERESLRQYNRSTKSELYRNQDSYKDTVDWESDDTQDWQEEE